MHNKRQELSAVYNNHQWYRLYITNTAQPRRKGFTGFSITIRQPVSSGALVGVGQAAVNLVNRPVTLPLYTKHCFTHLLSRNTSRF